MQKANCQCEQERVRIQMQREREPRHAHALNLNKELIRICCTQTEKGTILRRTEKQQRPRPAKIPGGTIHSSEKLVVC